MASPFDDLFLLPLKTTWGEYQLFCEFERFREAVLADGPAGAVAGRDAAETAGGALP